MSALAHAHVAIAARESPRPRVPFYRVQIGDEEIADVVSVMRSGWLTTGPRARQLESAFARYLGARHAVALSSCSAALHLSLRALGIGPGDAVLLPAMTFTATAEAVAHCGGQPVLVDCDEQTLCLDVDHARQLACRHGATVKAIVPVHYGGQMGDVFGVRELADEQQLRIVEDAAHTLPAFARKDERSRWVPVGQTANISCFSFYANKCITGGEGGMIVTDDEGLARRIALTSFHGIDRDPWRRHTGERSWDYSVVEEGFKCNLGDIAAAIGLRQLKKADRFLRQRTKLAQRYTRLLSDADALETPSALPNRRHSWHLYAIRLHLERLRIDRDQFVRELAMRGISTSVHWRPLHLHPYYRKAYGLSPQDLPVSSNVWPRLISLPLFPDMTQMEQDQVVGAVWEAAKRHRR